MHAELARPPAGGAHDRPVEWLGAGGDDLACPQQRPLLGQAQKLGSVRGGRAQVALGALEVAGDVLA
jgi:hypothetical protein